MKFVKENRLCVGCVTKGHMSSDCKKRLTCSVCHKKHPTCLHEERGDSKKKENKGEEGETTSGRKYTSYTSQGAPNVSMSMIVPVWISSLCNPDKEVLVYAILDTLLDSEKIPTKLRLTTISSKDALVDSYGTSPTSRSRYQLPTQARLSQLMKTTYRLQKTARNWEHL